jgi:hypothetical protein
LTLLRFDEMGRFRDPYYLTSFFHFGKRLIQRYFVRPPLILTLSPNLGERGRGRGMIIRRAVIIKPLSSSPV